MTEDGRVVYLSARQRNELWIQPILASDYLPDTHKSILLKRLREASRIYDEVMRKEERIQVEQ